MFLSFLSSIFSCITLLFGYISSNNMFPPPLSKSEEDYLLKKFLLGDTKAKEKLIEHNLRLVAHISKKYSTTNADNEEYISIGTIGLIKGINSFKNNSGYKLSTYCSRCIENEILMYLRSQKKHANDISLNGVIGTDKDGNDLELVDILESPEIDPVENMYNATSCKKILQYITQNLSERERQILTLRYGLNGNKPKTQQEVANVLKISRSYVSRIETKIQNTIKNELNL